MRAGALLKGEQRRLARMRADADDEFVANPRGAQDHVDVAVRQRIERAGIERNAGHALLSIRSKSRQWTPSFFCRLDEDVVYWNVSRLSG